MPVIVAVGPIKIYSMGLFLLIGIISGLYVWWKMGKDEHLEETELFDAFFLGLMAFFVIGRTGYVALHSEDLGTLFRYLAFLRYPGISYVSGVVGALLSVIIFARSKMWKVDKILDMAAVTIALILIFGSIGGLLNGMTPGKEIGWGWEFPGHTGKRFPVDLVGLSIFLLTFGLTHYVRKNFRFFGWYKKASSEAKEGLAMLFFGLMTGVYYLIRGFLQAESVHIWKISLSSWIGAGLIIISLLFIYLRADKEVRPRLFKFISHKVRR